MYLKSIEVHGFKSFANKILFTFHNGITGIVGPNGSGKSNVADAVRWVLGEQKIKQLRGASMQDVIFAGTESRKPLGFAYVAITLDNSDHKLAIDFEEVTVARRIYRSGESEYLINGSACRLKDIQELFYDTGIGKEGYSIIGQGQIDKILSGKPEERRELFDEAAGIVKYKRRKNTAQKKLSDEQQNLVRVNDILAELEKQLGPLERQSESAKEYLKKKEELKRYDVNMFLLETAHTKEQLASVEEKHEIAENDLQRASREYKEQKEGYEKLEDQIQQADDHIEMLKNKKNESTILKKQLESQIDILNEQIHTEKINDEHLQSRTLTIVEELKDRTKQKEALSQEKESIQKELDAGQQKESEVQGRLTIQQHGINEKRKDSEAKKSKIIELLNEQGNTKSRRQRYDTMLEQINLRKTEMNQKLLEIKSSESEQQEFLTEYKEKYQTAKAKADELQTEMQGCEQEVNRLQEENQQLSKQISQGQTAYHREQSRLESLKNITERYDGYGNSIRKVMEKKDSEPGLIGVVADIIKVKKEYELAIETALGGSIQNVVTNSEDTAKRMIGYLKQNKLGRATFLPLTSIRNRQEFRNSVALKEPGVIGLASTLVTTEERFSELANYLLGRTVVARNIEDGIALARKYQYSLRIVTLEGESLNPGGSMTGGAFRNSSNLLGRRREMEELDKSVELLKQDLERAQSESEAIKGKRAACFRTIDELKEQIQQVMLKQNSAKMNIRQAGIKLDELKGSDERLKTESRQIGGQIKEIQERIQEIEQESNDFDEQKNAIESQVTGLDEAIRAEQEKEAEIIKEAEKIRMDLANLRQRFTFVIQNIERVEDEMASRREEQAALKDNIEEAAKNIRKKEQDIQEIQKTIQNSAELFEELEAEIRKAGQERETLGTNQKEMFKNREILSEQKSALDKECFRLNSQKEKLEEAKEQLINYMWEEYEMTYSAAQELRDENFQNLEKMKKEMQVLREGIRRLGDVNVNAIEDYKNLVERYDFLSTQRDDLVTAEKTLLKIIEELELGMEKQFREKFKEISQEFDSVFKQLFGGGKGTLELLDEDDILETGITIIAQPPGKKLQNMMQLSGGEKALTAIALLFAIQNLKPSPFCLLDEIEAALDDSNVTRYADYLHKLTKNTQFIIITHRRGTMAAADRLYGITMQEKGISTLVSVNLIEESLDK